MRNKYLVLKADFNCKLMFCKINFILPNIYFTKLYSLGQRTSDIGQRWKGTKDKVNYAVSEKDVGATWIIF